MNRFPFIKIMIVHCLLARDGMTGYDLIKSCRGYGIPASSGTVYPHLKALEGAGLVECREDGRRKLYSLTADGRNEMESSGLATAPEFLRNIFFKSMSLASRMDWMSKPDIELLLDHVEEIKRYLSDYRVNMD